MISSVERRDPLDPLWIGEAQFERTFLLPLLACADFAMTPAMIFLPNREGLDPEQLFRSCGLLEKMRPRLLWTVTLPTIFGRSDRVRNTDFYKPHRSSSPEQASFTLRRTMRPVRRRLEDVRPRQQSSRWSDYGALPESYSSAETATKREFVSRMLRDRRPGRVLDVGCNTGLYGEIAAATGARVVAIDRDPAVIGRLWQTAKKQNLDILPLVVDVARPTPATGWQGEETQSFLRRCEETRFEAVLMLALVHHLLVTERVPMTMIADLAARITSDLALVEYVGPADSMFRSLVRGRDELFRDFDRSSFESTFCSSFAVADVCQTGADRYVYAFRRRPSC